MSEPADAPGSGSDSGSGSGSGSDLGSGSGSGLASQAAGHAGGATREAARSRFRRFIGVDLGGGRGKNTAVARLELGVGPGGRPRLGVAEAKVRHGQRGTGRSEGEPGGEALFRDEVLVAWLERWVDDVTVVAIDAPLTLPPCIRCQLPCPTVARCTVPVVAWMRRWGPRLQTRGRSDPGKPAVTPYTQRSTELLQRAVGVSPRETLGQGTGPVAARAAYLRRVLSPRLRLHENLVEVHPRATIEQVFGPELARHARHGDDDRVWATRKRVLAGLGEGIAFDYVWPELVVRNTHVFHAVLGAFTAFLWARRGLRGPTDLLDAEPVSATQSDLAMAIEELGSAWLEDGWVFVPPATGRSRRG
jgi:predicted nuclease with RNAse H fold